MSERYPGGIISKTAPTPSGPYQDSTAPGIWTLDQQAYWDRLGQWPTAGNPNPNSFIENLFSTWLYTGNGSTQTITNGIDISGKGGLVWVKERNSSLSPNNYLFDTVRGAGETLISNLTSAQSSNATVSAFTSSGFTDSTGWPSSTNVASWTFRKQPKFFDVVTYTGNGANRTISHNLGSVPGMIIVKRTDAVAQWYVYSSELLATEFLRLNATDAAATAATAWNSTRPTSSVFSVGTNGNTNANGGTYVAYLFAHNAGGFGVSGNENVISCGSYASGVGTINLGYEPQFVMFKATAGTGEWIMFDTMRGWPTDPPNKLLMAESSAAEGDTNVVFQPTSTGFNYNFSPAGIYVAIRRGPMQIPTLGTTVFNPNVTTSAVNSTTPNNRMLNATDVWWNITRTSGTRFILPRLAAWNYLQTNSTGAETTAYTWQQNSQNTIQIATTSPSTSLWTAGTSQVDYYFRRAPGFMDVVCYTGVGGNTTVTHNLGVTPELIIIKKRNATPLESWIVYNEAVGNTKALFLNSDAAASTSSFYWNNTSPTSSVITVGATAGVNFSGGTYVAYLFASTPGVSKVGSYTGNGTNQTINCGFSAGARFVMIKRTDSTGDWYVWDSARGIVAGNDPYLLLNSTAAEVTNTDFVNTATSGFTITSTAPAAINANGGSFIFLAIA